LGVRGGCFSKTLVRVRPNFTGQLILGRNRGVLPKLFLDHLWPVLTVWSLLYISDHTLTIWCAHLYRVTAREKIVYEGSFELNPVFQREVDALRWVSFRFVLALAATNLLLAAVWLTEAQSSNELYSFLLGAFILVQLGIHVRHTKNLFLFHAMRHADVVRGRIEYSRPLILRLSAVEFLSLAALYAVLFFFTRSWFVTGGVFACLLLAGKHWWLARRWAANRLPQGQDKVS